MKIEKVATRTDFPDDYITRISETGNVSELVMMKRKNCMATIQKLNKESYCILSTGEVKDYEHYETRADDSANNGYTQDVVTQYQISQDLAFAKAPLSTANETPILAYGIV